MQNIEQYLTDNANRFVDELAQFLRIPSVSGDSAFKADIRRAAEFVDEQLKAIGVESQIEETAGHPIVTGRLHYSDDAPTVLVYGHYDVQPPDPHDQWITPAFEPTVRDGKMFARGATDDKGQLYTHIKSLEAWVKTDGPPPVNLIYVIEGEEEVGSANLDTFLSENKERLKCDVAVISDTSQYGAGTPAITYGLRGIVACEIKLRGPNQDKHSGIYGGAVANPANALARMIGKLHNDEGRVLIPGFYDDVQELTPAEREQFAALPFDESAFLADLGMKATFGENGFSTLERRWARPTCDVNGILSGYTGEGPKTIIPAESMAKITCRLVPNQDPKKIVAALETFLRDNCPPGIEFSFQADHGAPGTVVDPTSKWMTAAKKALAAGFGQEPVLIREGGSIPVVTTFRDVLGVDTLLLGWGRNTDNLHSPNEHFHLDDYQRGIRSSAHLWKYVAEISR